MRRRKRRGWRRYINLPYVGSFFITLFILLPMYWMLASSFKTQSNVGASPPQYFPNPISTSSYHSAFNDGFGGYIANSLIIAICSTALVLVFGTFAGYALGRLPMRGKYPVMISLLMISVFPEIAVVAPLYLILKDVGWLNSYQALIFPYTAFNLPFAIWILRNYFLGISLSMEESARIDGAGSLRTLWSIVFPQVRPGVFTAGVFTFTACWTEFLMALSFDFGKKTIPVGIASFGSQFTVPYGAYFAASVIAVVPIAILVLVFRKAVVSGLTSGAVKG
ncbi:MAG: carbohydrate ABC transporter permease [Actinomycetota bacterium]|jgi:multiple sugar transport system permease protein|nr:carbohydrate ABC transporter permease [Actinomycetota bacterium]